ncbi:MAG: SRPBCC family protein [Opitutaceae bacterium]|nr:SRPBCC family protein [Opitutaceae bacterium]
MKITIETLVAAPVEKVWEAWTTPHAITQWNFASADWHCPSASLDLRSGGKFSYRMEAKDGSFGFDFGGTFSSLAKQERIDLTIDDGRQVTVMFASHPVGTKVTETFEAEGQNSAELQRQGWQAILDNFKHYVEATAGSKEAKQR